MSMFQIDISSKLGAEYLPMFNDVARFMMIQIGIQVMMSLTDGDRYPFFSADFFLLLAFLIVGVMLYHMVFKSIVEFR